MAQPDNPQPDHPRRILAWLTAIAVASGLGVTAVLGGAAARPEAGPPSPDAAYGIAPPVEDAAADAAPADAAQERQARLLEAEDDRVFAIVSDSPRTPDPYEVPAARRSSGVPGLPTVVLTARERPYDLLGLERLGAASRLPDGSWLLARSVLVGRGAELRIEAPGNTVRLLSGAKGFASIVAFKGALRLAGRPGAPLAVTSWDPSSAAADVEQSDGRAYIRAVGARMDVVQTAVADLGFWSGRTGGVAWTGSAGAAATGSVVSSTVERGHYGLFTSRAADLLLDDTTVRGSDLDGLLLHRETTGLVARRLTSTGNGRDGIAAARGAEHLLFTEVTSSDNAGNGIRIDGSPLADEATPSGASTARGAGYAVERSIVIGNVETGVLIAEAGGIALRDNTVTGNRDGIVLRGPAGRPTVTGNTVEAAGFGIAVRGGTRGAELTGNRIGSAAIGIQVTDAAATVHDNDVTGASRYGVSLVGDVTGSAIAGNRLGGRGLSALDVNRIGMTATADIVGNDASGWITDRDDIRDWRDYGAEHPLLLLWLLILALPLAVRLRARRRRRHAGYTPPYRNAAPLPGPPGISHLGLMAADRSLAGAPTVALPVTRVTVVSPERARGA